MKLQLIAIRVDASAKIGTGHFMRCLTLADALQRNDVKICFVSRYLPEYLRSMLVEKGHDFVLLDSARNDTQLDELAHSDWLGVSQQSDAADTIRALTGQLWDWMVIDHYALDLRWERILRRTAKRIMVIDDIADRKHDCDVLLDQNFYTDMQIRYDGMVPERCQLLLGPSYALLRKEFGQLHKHVKPRKDICKRILVFFGGVDADNYTGCAIEAINSANIPDSHVDVVIGAQHPYREQIEAECIKHKFICHVQTQKMAELMESTDLAIGAGGSASWERCCMGLPALLVALADNQINIAKDLDRYGACIYLGTAKSASVEIMRNAITSLLNAPSQLRALSEKAYSLVDGMGADRVCRALGC